MAAREQCALSQCVAHAHVEFYGFRVINPKFLNPKILLACGRVLEEAFQDLQALMNKAAEMVSLAERYRVALAQQACRPHPTVPRCYEPGITCSFHT